MEARKKVTLIIFSILNVGYCFIGWCVFTLYMMTSPSNEKFDLNPYFRNIVFPLLLLAHLIGEIAYTKKCHKVFFCYKKNAFVLFVLINSIVYILPLFVEVVERIIS